MPFFRQFRLLHWYLNLVPLLLFLILYNLSSVASQLGHFISLGNNPNSLQKSIVLSSVSVILVNLNKLIQDFMLLLW